MVLLIVVVLRTMCLGVVTPTEATALGAFVSLLLAAGGRRLRASETQRPLLGRGGRGLRSCRTRAGGGHHPGHSLIQRG